MVLGKRGMNRVHLVDAAPELGGCMRQVAGYPHLGEWGRVVDYRRIQLEKLKNVEVILKMRLSAEEVLTYGAEIVVVATGARWRADGMNGPTQATIPGAERPDVHTPEQVFEAGGAIAGEWVLVYDTDGYFTGVAMAEMLRDAGKQVTVVTPFPSLAQYMFFTGEAFRVNRQLRASGVAVVPGHVVTEIGAGMASGVEVWSPDPVSWQADAFVLVTQREPVDEVFREVSADPARLEEEGIEAVYRVGDCVAPRLIAECVFDGHRLAREIDSEDPTVPLPYLREVPAPPDLSVVGAR